MRTYKILTVIGARPQFIKASVVSAALGQSACLREVVVHTGQHFDANMSDVFFNEFRMRKPDYSCSIHGGSHGAMTGRMLISIEQILLAEAPDAVLVYGDTNSTLAGALAAVKLGIPVAHVEAGLRSFNMAMPEEINRILTDRISRWLFVPTASAAAQLASEGVPHSRIHSVGDVMFDVARRHGARCDPDGALLGALSREHGITAGAYCLATIHRAESTNHADRLRAICAALIALGRELPVIFPLHPRTRQTLRGLGALDSLAAAVLLIAPLGYRDMVQLEKYAALIATDSGGVQKEAFFHQVPCVTLRDETEWTELVDAGWNRLAPPTSAAAILLALRAAIGTRGQSVAPYGDGNAAKHIVTCLERELAGSPQRQSDTAIDEIYPS
ncbi:non-hydrolyzing UDP-N-acetylglucosamine 2-epimerase [Massilia sp. DWR3-1-1]|uniref:non-hydrolyzing UDP-N-acetylglucosamine 2-epimerase n=1 Tax=Massilia sp. DWR3-1-1 TaxID=2804559 RepID=UPI003CE8CCF4